MKKLIPIIIVIVLLVFITKGWWDSQLSPVSKNGDTESFLVTKGQSLAEIADSLQEKGLIKSATVFKFYTKQNGLDSRIQEGTFKLSPSMTSQDIAITLTNQPLEGWVTLLEGWRVEEMAEELSSELGVKSSEFLKSAKEGYMFPDTYLFPRDIEASQVTRVLRENFEKKYSPEIRSKIRNLGLTEEEGVILASIVEREARSDEVRTQVASILLKRLNIGMGLNADATVQYALVSKGSENPPAGGWWKKRILYEDLKIDSPYNTYIHSGLPPASISNPSLSSLQAVANANPKTPYLYYFHDSKGNSYYARTLEEHNENVANHR